MGQIQNLSVKPEYIENKPSQVISMTDSELFPAKFTDASGRVSVLLALFFGTDTQTGEPHMVVMNPDKIQELFVVPAPHLRKDLLRLYKQKKAPTPELPEGKVGSFELSDVATPGEASG